MSDPRHTVIGHNDMTIITGFIEMSEFADKNTAKWETKLNLVSFSVRLTTNQDCVTM
jgi:hypothetical protein